MEPRSALLSATLFCATVGLLYYSMQTAMASTQVEASPDNPVSVLQRPLEVCSTKPMTGYMRDGYCKLTESDTGTHVVCARVTEAFLNFTKSRGNDLSSPHPMYGFPGLKDGDRWCLCALRWKEAFDASPALAPPVILGATNERATSFVSLAALQDKAV